MSARARFAIAATGLCLSACTLGPVWAPRVEGRVVFRQTGEPVRGALVVASYRYSAAGVHPTYSSLDDHSAWSDGEGHFVVEGHWAIYPGVLAAVERRPDLYAVHPAYGDGWARLRGDDASAWRNVTVEIDAHPRRLEQRIDGKHAIEICSYQLRSRPCQLLCAMAYGPEPCER